MFRLSYSGFVIQNGRRKLFWNQAQMNREESVYCQSWRGETKERGRRVRGWGGHLASRSMRKTRGSLKGKTGFLGRPRISVIRRRTGATLLHKNDRLGKRLWRSKTTESEGGRGRGAGAFHERSNQSWSGSLSKAGRRRQREEPGKDCFRISDVIATLPILILPQISSVSAKVLLLHPL